MRNVPVKVREFQEQHSATQPLFSRREALGGILGGITSAVAASFLHAQETTVESEPMKEYDEEGRLIKECIQSPSGEISHKLTYMYHPKQKFLQRRSRYNRKNNIYPLSETETLWGNGSVRFRTNVEKDSMQWYSKSGIELFRQLHASNAEQRETYLIDRHGSFFGDVRTEQRNNPQLTLKEYIQKLKRAVKVDPHEGLHPVERIAVYQKFFLQYEKEPPNEDKWLSLEEMLKNGGKGDCDDYAFAAKELCEGIGIYPQVIHLPRHCMCVYIHKKNNGLYEAVSLGNDGLDVNGNMQESSYEREELRKGYATPQEALDSLLLKFKREISRIDVSNFTIDVHDAKILQLDTQKYTYIDLVPATETVP